MRKAVSALADEKGEHNDLITVFAFGEFGYWITVFVLSERGYSDGKRTIPVIRKALKAVRASDDGYCPRSPPNPYGKAYATGLCDYSRIEISNQAVSASVAPPSAVCGP